MKPRYGTLPNKRRELGGQAREQILTPLHPEAGFGMKKSGYTHQKRITADGKLIEKGRQGMCQDVFAKLLILHYKSKHQLKTPIMKANPNDHSDYETMLDALEGLKAAGFQYDFNLVSSGIQSKIDDKTVVLSPSEFDIVEVHRFEGMSNPSDNSILYAIESKGGLKGTLVSAYGVYADTLSNEMIEKLDTRHLT
jgi:hypothetical protein